MSTAFQPSPLFTRVERARRLKHKLRDEHITLAHGSGGRAMHELVEGLFVESFRNPILESLEDQAVFEVSNGKGPARLAFTTDSYVVTPLFFAGGDIGRLAVNGTVNDIAMNSEVCIEIEELQIPVREEVQGACEILGLDPLYVANEGKLIAIVSASAAEAIITRMRSHRYGAQAAVIGEVKSEPRGIVSMKTGFGGTRIVDMLTGDQLPRIC